MSFTFIFLMIGFLIFLSMIFAFDGINKSRLIMNILSFFVIMIVGYVIMQNVFDVLGDSTLAINTTSEDMPLCGFFGDCSTPTPQKLEKIKYDATKETLDCNQCVKTVRNINNECEYNTYYIWNPVERKSAFDKCVEEQGYQKYNMCVEKCPKEYKRLLEQLGEWNG